jgi:predicted permease
MLARSPGFSAVAVLTLALGIGANTAIFSVVNGVLLRPLAYPHPERLYLVREVVVQWMKTDPSMLANLPDFRIWQKQVRSFEDVAIAESASAILSGAGEPERIHGVRASTNLFALLGVRPAMGRAFQPEEDERGRGNVVMVTDHFWRSRFNSDPSLLGRVLMLDGAPHEVVGILPVSFHFPAAMQGTRRLNSPQDFFEPLNGPYDYEQDLIGEFDFAAIARLKPGVSPESALAELNAVQAGISEQAKQNLDLRALLLPLEEKIVGPARGGLILFLGAVAAVLLIVCANLAGLLLARVPARMREAAVRTALGATRARLMQQMLTESLLLSSLGGALGVWLANLGVEWFVGMAPVNIPRLDEVHMDVRALGFALFVTALTGVLFGLLPAWRVTRTDPHEALKSGFTAATGGRGLRRVRESLVGFEVALSTLLLILAGLLTTSMLQLLRVDTGYAVENVLVADIDLSGKSYALPADRVRLFDSVLAGVRTLPGVREAGWVNLMPLAGEGSVTGIRLPGQQNLRTEGPFANYRATSPEYFRAMGIHLLYGRVFTEADRGRKVVVISKSVADRFWPGQDPTGKICVTQWGADTESEVIGVVGDIRTVRLEDAPLQMVYVPHWFNEISVPQSLSIIISTSMDPVGSAAAVREVVHRVDPQAPVVALRPMTEIVAHSVAPRRFETFLALVFALLALFLASLGIFGVVAYAVEQRRKELGIRMALGAQSSDLRKMVLLQGMAPVAIGLAAGIAAAVLVGRVISSLLFGVGAYDPWTILSVAMVVGVTALAACYLPARRAMRVDPMVALRYE